jgi:hypothetical protein
VGEGRGGAGSRGAGSGARGAGRGLPGELRPGLGEGAGGQGGMFGAGGSRGRRRGDDEAEAARRRGRENLWTLPQGAPGVVEPADDIDEPDPGPALGR